jgi:hypothetical protein
VLLSEKSEGPSPSIPAPILLGVQAMAMLVAGGDFLSRSQCSIPKKSYLAS